MSTIGEIPLNISGRKHPISEAERNERAKMSIGIVLRSAYHNKQIDRAVPDLADGVKDKVKDVVENVISHNDANAAFNILNQGFDSVAGNNDFNGKKNEAEKVFNLIKQQANVAASSHNILFHIGRVTSAIPRLHSVGDYIASGFNRIMRDAVFGKLMGDRDINKESYQSDVSGEALFKRPEIAIYNDNLATKHAEVISEIKAYGVDWKEERRPNAQAARFGGKDFWEHNKDLLSKMGLTAENFYTNYKIPGGISAEAFHDGFMYGNGDREKLFNAMADYNPEIKKLYDDLLALSKEKTFAIPLDKDAKSTIISGIACQFTAEDIKGFFLDGFIDDNQYPEKVKEWNGIGIFHNGNMVSRANPVRWQNNSYLGQHNWSPCQNVIGIIENYLNSNTI